MAALSRADYNNYLSDYDDDSDGDDADGSRREEAEADEDQYIADFAAQFKCLNCSELERKLQKIAAQLKVSDLCALMLATADVHSQWRELGDALGVPDVILDKIPANESHTTFRYMYEMFEYWVVEIGGSWESLAGALRNPNVEQDELAIELEKKHQGDDQHQLGHVLHIVTKDERILQESDIPVLMDVFSTDHGVDWKVLGLILGIPQPKLQTIDLPSVTECQRAVLKEWIESGEAYWSILLKVLAGPLFDKKQLANDIIARIGFNLKPFSFSKVKDTFEITEDEIEAKSLEFRDAISTSSTNRSIRGIVVFVGVSDSGGTDVDSENVGSTFREDLNFCFYPQSNLKCRDLSCLIKSMARAKYFGTCCKTVVFYYAGHGGINENGESFIKLPDGEFYIDRDIVCHFNGDRVNKTKRFLFFFDSCLSGDPQPDTKIQIPYVPVGSLLAHATSIGDKSFGYTSSGGIWTRLLCENLKKQLSVSDILDDTHTAVMVELKDAQKPMYVSRTGSVFLKGRPKLPDEDLSQLTDPVKLWKHHGKEIKTILGKSNETLMSLTGGLHSKEIIDDETNSQVLEHYHTAEGPEMIYSGILKKLEEENDRDMTDMTDMNTTFRYNVTIGRSRSGYDPSLNISVTVLMSTVLDIMDVQDQLCGLVRRMRNILDSQKLGSNILREYHEEILDCLQGNKTAIISLSGALRTAGLIDSLTNNNVCSADFTFGPQTLLKCLEKVVDSKPQLLLKILSLMKKHECLCKVVEEMKKMCTADLQQDVSLYSQIMRLKMEKEQLEIEVQNILREKDEMAGKLLTSRSFNSLNSLNEIQLDTKRIDHLERQVIQSDLKMRCLFDDKVKHMECLFDEKVKCMVELLIANEREGERRLLNLHEQFGEHIGRVYARMCVFRLQVMQIAKQMDQFYRHLLTKISDLETRQKKIEDMSSGQDDFKKIEHKYTQTDQ